MFPHVWALRRSLPCVLSSWFRASSTRVLPPQRHNPSGRGLEQRDHLWWCTWSRTSLHKTVATNQTRSLSHAVWRVQRKRWSFLLIPLCHGLPKWLSGEEPACQCRRCRRHGFNPWIRKIPWRRKRQPTPIFLPGKSHGQRSLTDYSPWGDKRIKNNLTAKQETSTILLQSLL